MIEQISIINTEQLIILAVGLGLFIGLSLTLLFYVMLDYATQKQNKRKKIIESLAPKDRLKYYEKLHWDND